MVTEGPEGPTGADTGPADVSVNGRSDLQGRKSPSDTNKVGQLDI